MRSTTAEVLRLPAARRVSSSQSAKTSRVRSSAGFAFSAARNAASSDMDENLEVRRGPAEKKKKKKIKKRRTGRHSQAAREVHPLTICSFFSSHSTFLPVRYAMFAMCAAVMTW